MLIAHAFGSKLRVNYVQIHRLLAHTRMGGNEFITEMEVSLMLLSGVVHKLTVFADTHTTVRKLCVLVHECALDCLDGLYACDGPAFICFPKVRDIFAEGGEEIYIAHEAFLGFFVGRQSQAYACVLDHVPAMSAAERQLKRKQVKLAEEIDKLHKRLRVVKDELRALGGADEAGSSSDPPLAPSSV